MTLVLPYHRHPSMERSVVVSWVSSVQSMDLWIWFTEIITLTGSINRNVVRLQPMSSGKNMQIAIL